MAATHTETGATPPYALLLAHFRNTASVSEARDNRALLPSYDQTARSHSEMWTTRKGVRSYGDTVQPSLAATEDEESKCGFYGGDSQQMDYTNSSPVSTVAYVWCIFILLLLPVFGLYSFVHLTFSLYGSGTGMAQWIVYRHRPPPSSYKMSFCLVSPNREAPGPQSWRHMLPGTLDECTTDTVSLTIGSKETGMIRPGDVLLFVHDILHHEERAKIRTSVAGEEMHRVRLGDDLAEEGRLGRTI